MLDVAADACDPAWCFLTATMVGVLRDLVPQTVHLPKVAIGAHGEGRVLSEGVTCGGCDLGVGGSKCHLEMWHDCCMHAVPWCGIWPQKSG